MKLTAIFAGLLLAPTLSFAHGNRAEFAGSAALEGTKVFSKEQPAQVKNFKNVTSEIISGMAAKVEIFLLDNSKAATYNCNHMDHNGEMMIVCK